jgi:hypothetical protein
MSSSININDRKFKASIRQIKKDAEHIKHHPMPDALRDYYHNLLLGAHRHGEVKKESDEITREHILFCGKCDKLHHWSDNDHLPFSMCFGLECKSCETACCIPGLEDQFKQYFDEDPLYYTE